MTSAFSKNLTKYRKKLNLTQGQLAAKLNVTPQAVSKWENGNLPDADMLPSISSALGVSIDVLFGIAEERSETDIEQTVSHIIRQTPENQRADAVMKIMYAIVGAYTEYRKSKVKYPEDLELETFNMIRTDNEMALSRLNEDLKYSFFMKVPENGLFPYIESTERMVNLFETLADEDALRLISYFGSGCRNLMLSIEFLSKNLNISYEKTKYIMDRLDRLGLVWRASVHGADESSIVYAYSNSPALTFIIVLAKSLTRYIRFCDCNIDSWSHGPFHMPETNISTPVPQVGLWSEEKKFNQSSNESPKEEI